MNSPRTSSDNLTLEYHEISYTKDWGDSDLAEQLSATSPLIACYVTTGEEVLSFKGKNGTQHVRTFLLTCLEHHVIPLLIIGPPKSEISRRKHFTAFIEDCKKMVSKGTYAWLPFVDAGKIKIDSDGDFAQQNRAAHAALTQEGIQELLYFIKNTGKD